jgi:hypothetical protein
MNIRVSYESARGCGYRKGGGIYLVCDGQGRYCGALPIPLGVCPTCHHGIKPARGWTWVNLAELASVRGCKLSEPLSTEGDPMDRPTGCGDCPIADAKIQEVGLIWVGEKFYPTPGNFVDEAARMGISRRITALPRRFKLGETWVALAHRKTVPEKIMERNEMGLEVEKIEFKPAIFHVFLPSRVEYVVRETDEEEKLNKLEERGFSLVRVVPKAEQEAA